MTRIGVLGGTFDPIHMAHLMIAEWVRQARALDRVIFVPAGHPPHKPGRAVSPADVRLEMVRLAVADAPCFEVSDVELRREGPSYTLDTVRELLDACPSDTRLFWIIGGDCVRDLPSWYRIGDLAALADFIAVSRPGSQVGDWSGIERGLGADVAARMQSLVVPFPMIDISSTMIRRRVAAGESIRYLVPEPVRELIEARGLYRQG